MTGGKQLSHAPWALTEAMFKIHTEVWAASPLDMASTQSQGSSVL